MLNPSRQVESSNTIGITVLGVAIASPTNCSANFNSVIVFPAPGVIGELHVYFEVEIDPRARSTPGEDGSPLEAAAEIIEVSLADALRACAEGKIRDGKTELALRRLDERFRNAKP